MLRRKRLWLIVLLVACDQLLHTVWGYAESLEVNPSPERWFGLLPHGISYVLACCGLLALAYYNPPKNKRSKLGFSLAFAGALSNFMTELRYGQVVDYIVFSEWVVNLADALVVTGLTLLVLGEITKRQR